MSGVGLMLLTVVWWVFFSMTRQSKKLDTRLKALQASLLLTERLKTDLKQFYYVPGVSMAEASPPRLSFYIYKDYVYSPTERSQKCVVLEPITYIFDRETHMLRRNTEFLRFAQFEDISFTVKESTGGTTPDFSNSVMVRATYAPEELLATPDKITAKDRIVWTAMVGLPHRSLTEAYGFWLDNPFDKPDS